jgi:hypothetical protein
MINYKVLGWAGTRPILRKIRTSDKNARRNIRRYRRLWFWHTDRWNQRHGITEE